MKQKSSNPPHRHHYIPSFYLSRWAKGKGGTLCQYSKPHGTVVPNRKYPNATGYVDKLYELKGLAPEHANAVETLFMKPIDCAAHDALTLMEQDGNRARWDSRRRTGWAIFIHTLLLRAPEDIVAFKETWRFLMEADELGEWEAKYQTVRKAGDPPTFKAYMRDRPEEVHDRTAMNALVGIMDGGNVARAIFDMPWHVIDTSDADYLLLTSDRPTIMSNGLMVEGGHIAMPIGPSRIFVAARDQAAMNRILQVPHRQIVRESNRQVCDFAAKYVYGVDDSQLAFVAKHFGTKDRPRLVQATMQQRKEMASQILAGE